MLGRKVSWVLWFLLVGRTFDLGTDAIDINTQNNITIKTKQSTNSGNLINFIHIDILSTK